MSQQEHKHKFDLEERTTIFSTKILDFCRTITVNYLTENQIKQLIKSATSIGANYMEANGSDSKRDFRSKISICKKEAKETTHWLRMIATSDPQYKIICRKYWQEAHEFVLIFSSINNKKSEK